MDQQKPPVAQMIDLLRKEGNTEDQITDFLAKLTSDIAQAFYDDAMGSLTPEDLKAIDKTTFPEETNYEIRTRYHARTGKSPDQVTGEMYENFAKKFIESYHQYKDSPSKPAVTAAAKENDNQEPSANGEAPPAKPQQDQPPANDLVPPGHSTQVHGPLKDR